MTRTLGRYGPGLGLSMGVALALACPHDPGPVVGRACRALLDVAERAAGCDPALAELAAQLSTAPDEARCRRAARALVHGPALGDGRVRSIYTPSRDHDDSPLTDEELADLAALSLPADLVVTPDIAAQPGLPPTTAEVDGLALQADDDGRLTISTEPGVRTLRLRHAGRQRAYCVELVACETTALTAHGAQLARDPRVVAGPCPSPP